MQSSGNTTSSRPASIATAVHSSILLVLPSMSPTVGLICASPSRILGVVGMDEVLPSLSRRGRPGFAPPYSWIRMRARRLIGTSLLLAALGLGGAVDASM